MIHINCTKPYAVFPDFGTAGIVTIKANNRKSGYEKNSGAV